GMISHIPDRNDMRLDQTVAHKSTSVYAGIVVDSKRQHLDFRVSRKLPTIHSLAGPRVPETSGIKSDCNLIRVSQSSGERYGYESHPPQQKLFSPIVISHSYSLFSSGASIPWLIGTGFPDIDTFSQRH